jgi:hypothetical protein
MQVVHCNPQNGQWEYTDGKSQGPRTTLVFDPKMNSDSRFIENVLHETAVFPGNFNPENGQWESTDGKSRPRTTLVFRSNHDEIVGEDPRTSSRWTIGF